MFLVLGIVMAAAGVVCFFVGSSQYWELQFEINEPLPQDQKFEPLFWTQNTHLKFRQLQKQVLPKSTRLRRGLILFVVGACLFYSGVGFALIGAKAVLNS